MLIDLKKIISLIPLVSFLILFPVFFIYQFLLSQSKITALLGGYFGIMSLILLVPLLIVFIYNLLNNSKAFGNVDYLFIILMIYIFINALYNYAFGSLANNLEMLQWSISGVMFNFECYLIGKFSNFNNSLFKKITLILFLCISVMYAASLNQGVLLITNILSPDLVTYQGFARSIVFHAALLILFFNNNLLRLFLLSLSLIILITLGSRSETIIFLLSLLGVFFFASLKTIKGIIIASLIISAFIILLVLNIESILFFLEDTRFYEFYTVGVFNSSSSTARSFYSDIAFQHIYQNPFLGNYGIYLIHFGSIGAYPHNLISAWLNLGLMGFIFYILLLIMILYKSFINLYNSNNSYVLFSLYSCMFIILSFVFSKSYLFMFFGLAIGASSNIFLKRQ